MTIKNENQKYVRSLLNTAFPREGSSLSHDDCVKLRSRLSMLSDDDLIICLPKVLEDLIDTHTNIPEESEYVEAVVQHLNVLVEGTDLNFIKEYWGQESLAKTLSDEEVIRKEKEKTYSKFTVLQSLAIVKWLELAQDWLDLKWYREDVDRALLYWRSRATDS
jgi:hypothetical protein